MKRKKTGAYVGASKDAVMGWAEYIFLPQYFGKVLCDKLLNLRENEVYKIYSCLRQQRSHVPKFGNWENENVPYTAFFDKARQDRTGTKMTNPNDPEENPDLLPHNPSSADQYPSRPRADLKDPSGKRSAKSSLELQKSTDSNPNNSFGSPAHSGGHGGGSADTRKKPTRQSAGSEYSFERSPLHRQARTPGRDSPSWEGKNSYENSHGTPGRSRLRPVNRGDETPERGAAVPKFGDWDESNPASADGYTHIFNKVREERQGGAANAPRTPQNRPYVRNKVDDDKAQSCCFGWGRK